MLLTINYDRYFYSKAMKYLHYKIYIEYLKRLFFKFIILLKKLFKYIFLRSIYFLIKIVKKIIPHKFKSKIKYKLSLYPKFFNILRFIYSIAYNYECKNNETLFEFLVKALIKFIIIPTLRQLILKNKFKKILLMNLEDILKINYKFKEQITLNTNILSKIEDIPTPLMPRDENNLLEEEEEIYMTIVRIINIQGY